MMTQFAVATVDQARGLRGIKEGNGLHGFASHSAEYATFVKGWWERIGDFGSPAPSLTDAGRLAMELREVLGPDRNLTVAGAKAILRDNGTRATRTRLMEDGLRKCSFVIGQESTLTEDGKRIRAILLKYKAEV